MTLTRQQTIDYAVEVVDELNRIVMGLELNGRVCAVLLAPLAAAIIEYMIY